MHSLGDVVSLLLTAGCAATTLHVMVLLRSEDKGNGIRGLRRFFACLFIAFLWVTIVDVSWLAFGLVFDNTLWRTIALRGIILLGLGLLLKSMLIPAKKA